MRRLGAGPDGQGVVFVIRDGTGRTHGRMSLIREPVGPAELARRDGESCLCVTAVDPGLLSGDLAFAHRFRRFSVPGNPSIRSSLL